MTLHFLYLVSGAGYITLCAFASMQFAFVAAKSTSFSRLMLRKLTLYYVMRDKTVVKDLLCAVHISVLDG